MQATFYRPLVRRVDPPGNKLLAGLVLVSLLLAMVPTQPQPSAPLITPRLSETRAEVPPPLAQTTPALAPQAPPYPLPAELIGKPEVIDARTANSATFDMGDGTYALLQDSAPLHYRDDKGAWQPIVPAFTAVAEGWINSTNILRTSLAQHSSSAKISVGTAGVGWEPAGLAFETAAGRSVDLALPLEPEATTPGTLSHDGMSVRYLKSWSDAQIQDQWQSGPGHTEYTLRLGALPPVSADAGVPHQLDLSIQLHLRPGTSIQVGRKQADLPLETREALSFVGAQGETILLQPPRAYEQHSQSTSTAGSYALQATADPSVVELRVRIPWQWLAAPERQWPVIIDPLFQNREPQIVKVARYYLNNEHTFAGYYVLDAPEVGHFKDIQQQVLLKFDPQPLPPETTVTRAYVGVTPSEHSFANRQYLSAHVLLHQLKNGDWMRDNPNQNQPPAFDSAVSIPVAAGSDQLATLSYSRGMESSGGATWDVTDLVKSWLNPRAGSENYGLLLRMEQEFCDSNSRGCGGFRLGGNASWEDRDFAATDQLSSPDQPFTLSDKRGGIKLIVFFTGPILREGEKVDMSTENHRGGNPGADPPYYGARHEYLVPPLPNYWQAVAVRGFGPRTGPNPPTDEDYVRAQQGTFPLELRDGYGALETSLPSPNGVSYILLNGRRAAGSSHRLRVLPPSGDPLGYDVELVKERGTLETSFLGPATVVSEQISFDSADQLALWRIVVPPNSNSRVDIVVSTFNALGNTKYFSAGLFDGDSAAVIPGSFEARVGTELQQVASDDSHYTLSTGSFQASNSNYALALAYRGPSVDHCFQGATPDSFSEISASTPCTSPLYYVGRLSFNLNVHVTSCVAGSFPTADGTCQRVICPDTVAPIDQYREGSSGLGLWSPSGWTADAPGSTTEQSVLSDTAPLIGGPVVNGTRSVPHVAVIGGQITYEGATGKVLLSQPSNVLLIDCGSLDAPQRPVTNYFQVFSGSLQSQSAPGVATTLAPAALDSSTGVGIQIDPWSDADRSGGDLSAETFAVAPGVGQATGSATLRRQTGSNLFFATSWSVNVDGWPALTAAPPALQPGSPISVVVAGLDLSPGNNLAVDITPPKDKNTTRKFSALRAASATITQPAVLGGASKPVQALILPRGWMIPADPPSSCGTPSCIDLRALDDRPDHVNRAWALPDIHLTDTARTVALSTMGAFQVYSTDHPGLSAAPQAVNFSYDTFAGQVSVSREYCDPNKSEIVTVIKGQTQMTLPNIGNGATPDSSIATDFKLCESSLRHVHMEFRSSVGVPVGNSGLFMTGLSGTVDINPALPGHDGLPGREGNTRIQFGIDFQAAQGGDGGLLRAHGDVIIDTLGLFKFTGHGDMLKGFVGVDGALWVAWNPLDIGFNMQLSYPQSNPWLTGGIRAHMWKGQGWQGRYTWLPKNDDTHIAAELSGTLTIKKGQIFSWWFIDIPPETISISIDLAFGQFCTNDSCTSYEWGVKGKYTIAGYDIGIYYGFDHGFDFVLGNDGHILIDQYGGAQDVPNSLQLAAEDRLDGVQVRAAAPAVDGVALEPFTVTNRAENILVGLGWQAGSPQLSLITPDGEEIKQGDSLRQNVAISTTLTSMLIGVKQPTPGLWQAKISNLSASGGEHYKLIYFANHGTPVKRNLFLTPAQADENGTGRYSITWQVPADTPASSTINLYVHHTIPVTETTTRDQNLPIVQHLPLTAGSYTWNTEGLANGSYQVYAVVDDGVNTFPGTISNPNDTCTAVRNELPSVRAFDPQRFPGTTVFTATGTIRINDLTPPASPTGLTLSGIDGAIMARWDGPTDHKTVAYQARWGILSQQPGDPPVFDEEHSQRITASLTPTLRIGGLTNGKSYSVEITALDANDRPSAPSAIAQAMPDGVTDPIPLTPGDFAVTRVTSTSISFSWSPGSGPLPASYRLNYDRLGAASLAGAVDTSATSATIGDLQPGASYRVTLSAANRSGWRSASTTPLTMTITSSVDADSDGLPDDWADYHTVHHASDDSDHDDLTNLQEYQIGTDPSQQDTDNDGFSDNEELAGHTDPLDPLRYGAQLTQPRLSLDTDRVVLRFKLQSNNPILSEGVAWSNTGGGTLHLQAMSDQSWLKALVSDNRVQLSIDPTQLEPGYHVGVVKLGPTADSDPLIGRAKCIRVETWASPPDSGYMYRRFLPLVARGAAPSLTAKPDLVASLSLSPNKRTFAAGEPVTITATITNTGEAAAGPFWADLFINPSQPPTAANIRWNDRCGLEPCFGLAWRVADGLAPGQSITLTSRSFPDGYSIWPGWFASGTSDLYLYADTWNPGSPDGAVVEGNETNNRAEIHGLQVTGTNPSLARLMQVDAILPRPQPAR